MKPLLERIARRVRAARKNQGRTARAVAASAGLSPRFYAQLEAGEANIAIGRLASVADALGISLSRLVEEDQPPRVITLLGLRGAGKSTLGPSLARSLRIDFVELDSRVESVAGLWLSEIFAFHGEAYYRRLETQCLEEILEEGRPSVVALSGGVVHNKEAFALIRSQTTRIWLRARPEDHMQRVLDMGDDRPVRGRENAMAELRRLLAARDPLYRDSDLTLDTSRSGIDEVLSRALEGLNPLGWRTMSPPDGVAASRGA